MSSLCDIKYTLVGTERGGAREDGRKRDRGRGAERETIPESRQPESIDNAS